MPGSLTKACGDSAAVTAAELQSDLGATAAWVLTTETSLFRRCRQKVTVSTSKRGDEYFDVGDKKRLKLQTRYPQILYRLRVDVKRVLRVWPKQNPSMCSANASQTQVGLFPKPEPRMHPRLQMTHRNFQHFRPKEDERNQLDAYTQATPRTGVGGAGAPSSG